MLGLSLDVFTALHVAISFVGMAAGFVFLGALFAGVREEFATFLFLAATVVTSVTGFLFPAAALLPSHVVGVISLVLLAVAIAARYGFHNAGVARPVFILTAIAALYLNVFVLVAQVFLKFPAVNALAPTGGEPPFLVAQVIVLAAFVVMGFVAFRRGGRPARKA
jgi:hypothetical protein